MKAILGIDPAGAYKPALHLLERLRFPVDELVLATGTEGESEADVDDEKSPIQHAIREGLALATAAGFTTRTEVASGSAVNVLIDLAEGENADLIAIQSQRKSAFQSFFFGSVGRGLTIGATRS